MRADATVLRFLLNGLAATGVHYSVLTILMEVVHFGSAAIANGIAAAFGISASYVGNRSFVFQSTAAPRKTLPAFLMLYAAVCLLHVAVLGLWTDYAKLPYTSGFLIAMGIAALLTFVGNRYLVFPPASDHS